jgi:negative regulator of flagellin synthesis FlgM
MEITGKKTHNGLDSLIKNIDAGKRLKTGLQQPAPASQTDGDKVELSAQAKQVQAASKIATSFPEVREDKVAQIRNQIETGTYQIDAGKIAAAMLKEAFSDESS